MKSESLYGLMDIVSLFSSLQFHIMMSQKTQKLMQ